MLLDFLFWRYIKSVFYFHGMHPVAYPLVNGISRSVYTTIFNSNEAK
jgi:hypothetical protein